MARSTWSWPATRSFPAHSSSYMQTVAPNAFVFCMGGSATYRVAKEAGQPVIREFYADRDYDDSGSIVFTRACRQARSRCDCQTKSFAPARRARCERWTASTSTSSSSPSASIPTRSAAVDIAHQDARCAYRQRRADRAGIGSLPKSPSLRGMQMSKTEIMSPLPGMFYRPPFAGQVRRSRLTATASRLPT